MQNIISQQQSQQERFTNLWLMITTVIILGEAVGTGLLVFILNSFNVSMAEVNLIIGLATRMAFATGAALIVAKVIANHYFRAARRKAARQASRRHNAHVVKVRLTGMARTGRHPAALKALTG